MKYKKYPKYKSSGIEWLGEIPEHWEVRRLKRFASIKNGNSISDKLKEYFAIQKGLPYISTKDIDLNTSKINYNVVLHIPNDNLKEFKISFPNSVLICIEGGSAGKKIAFNTKKVCYVNKLASIKSHSKDMDDKYLYYFVKTKNFNFLFNNYLNGMIGGVSVNDLKSFPILLPPLSEQKAIATFLDKATEKIDNLIQKEEELIKLLEEKKEALITKAVTKGLKNAKMKDSGIEWLGEIPEHWEVRKLKYLINGKLQYGANESGQTYNPNLPRYIRITDFDQNGKLANKNKLSLSWEKAKNYLLKKGDVLFARSGATVGKTFQFNPEKLEDKYYAFAGYLIKAEPNKKIITSDFLYFFTTSKAYKNWKDYIFSKSTIENIGADKYSELILPLPPLQEQKEITEYLDKKLAKIDKLIEKSKKAIELLKEKKEALITNAVTGKIDVRESYEV